MATASFMPTGSTSLPVLRTVAGTGHLWKFAVLGSLVCWLLVVGSHHEPWMDEAQAWLIARDSGLSELFMQRVRYEGTPGLWHLILWTLIRCGFPYALLFTIPAACAVAGAAIVLWRAPFPGWMRTAVVGSYFFAYQYGVIARSYSVDLVLVPLAACWFGSRRERPLRYAVVLGLLANLNTHSFFAAAVLGAELLLSLFKAGRLQRKGSLTALATVAALGLFAAFSAWQPSDNGYLREHRPVLEVLLNFIEQAFVDRVNVFSSAQLYGATKIPGFAVTLLALWPSLRLIAAGPVRWLAVALGAALFGFSAFFAAFWHSGILYLFWLFALWNSWPAPGERVQRPLLAGFAVIAASHLVTSVQTGLWDIRQTFSPAREAAAFVTGYKREHPGAKVASFGFKTFAMQPWWAGNQFANYKEGAAHPAYLDWRKGQKWNPFAQRLGWLDLLASKPDLIVASMSTVGNTADPDGACEAGYRLVRRLPGEMVWRGTRSQNETLLILEHQDGARDCSHRPAA